MSTILNKKGLEKQVIHGVRELGIQMVLFRHIVGSMLGLNVTDMECLGVLFFKRISTPSELSKYTGLTSGATTAMLDRLERARIIQRYPNPNDRRGILIRINKKASKKIDPLFASSRKSQNDLVSRYSKKELAFLSEFLEQSVAMWENERVKLKKKLDS